MEEELRSIMAEVFEVPVGQIDKSTTMDTLDSWDSLRHMELLVALERRFDVEIEAEEAVEMTSIESIKRVLAAKKDGTPLASSGT